MKREKVAVGSEYKDASVYFDTYEGVDVFVGEDGKFRYRLSKAHHEREARTAFEAKREIKESLEKEQKAKRERPAVPCLVVTCSVSETEYGRHFRDYSPTAKEAPAYHVQGAIFCGINASKSSPRVKREGEWISDEYIVAIFKADEPEKANRLVAALAAKWERQREEHEAKAAGVSGGATSWNGYMSDEWEGEGGRKLDRGEIMERHEDNVAAELKGEPIPWPVKKKTRRGY